MFTWRTWCIRKAAKRVSNCRPTAPAMRMPWVRLRCVASDYTALRDADLAQHLAKPEASELA